MTKLMGSMLALLVLVPALATAQAQPAKVKIVSPKPNAVVTGSTVQIVLESQGVEIAPAAAKKPGTAHYHLFIDTNLTRPDSAIPMGSPGVIHLGKGQSDYTLEVAPGTHRIIAQLADPNHVPLAGAATDTIQITVKP